MSFHELQIYTDGEWRTVSAVHDMIADLQHTATGASQWDLVGCTGVEHLGWLTPSYEPDSASILRTDNSGHLTLVQLNTDRIEDKNGANLTIAPTGDLVLDPTGSDVIVPVDVAIRATNYASQTTGWRVTGSGSADFRYLFTDELHAKVFVADLEQALAGGQIIAKSVAMLSRAFTAPAAGGAVTLYVWDLPSAENMAVFEAGDIVMLRNFSRAGGSLSITNCYGVVTNYTDLADKEQSWTFTRSTDDPGTGLNEAGAMLENATVGVDSLIIDFGTTGNGYYEVNAIDGQYAENSPYMQIVTWETHPASGKTVRVRTGNLYGITTETEYGFYAGDGYSDTAQYVRITDENVQIHNIALECHSGDHATVIIEPGTPYLGMGAYAPTTYLGGAGARDGFWFGNDSGTYKFYVGDVDGEVLTWTGAELQIGAIGDNYINLTGSGIELYSDGVMVIYLDGSGDVVFGQVTNDKPNLYWDYSEGRLNFRGGAGGAEVQAYVDTDGSIVAGGGTICLDVDGASIIDDPGGDNAAFRFISSTHTGWSRVSGVATANDSRITMRTWPGTSGYDAVVGAYGQTDNDTAAYLQVNALVGGDNTFGIANNLSILGAGALSGNGIGFEFNSSTEAWKVVLNGAVFDEYLSGDSRVGGGLYVGATGTDPSDNCIHIGGDGINSNMTVGLTIDQAGNDDQVLSFKSSDVSHTMTTQAEADTFGAFRKREAEAGGLEIAGYKDSAGTPSRALVLIGRLGEAADTAKSTEGYGVVHVAAQVTDGGTSVTTVGSDGNLFSIANSGTTRFIFDAEGSAHGDVEWTTFDKHDDLALLEALEAGFDPVRAGFGEVLQENRETLQAANVVNFYDTDGSRAMVNFTRLAMLHTGAIRQLGARLERYERELVRLGADPARLLN